MLPPPYFFLGAAEASPLLALKSRVCPKFTVLNMYVLSFRIFEQLLLALKFSRREGGSLPRPPPRAPMTARNSFPTA